MSVMKKKVSNKKKSRILTIIAAAALSGASVTMTACSGWTPFGREYFNEADAKVTASYGTPWLNSVTYGMVRDDTEHNLKDDFYLDVNYDWLKNTELSEGKKRTGVYESRTDDVKTEILSLFTEKGTGKDAEAVNNLYSLYLDWNGRNSAGFDAVKERVRSIEKINDLTSLSEYLKSEDAVKNGSSVVSFDFDFDYNDPEYYSFVIVPTQLSLGDAAEYSSRTDYGDKMYDSYKKQAQYLLKKAGYVENDANAIIDSGFEFEKLIASFMKDQAFKFSDEYAASVNNPRNSDELEKAQGDFPLTGILETYGILDSDHIFLLEPEWLDGIRDIYKAEHVEDIKNYLLIKTLQRYAYISDEETFREMKMIYGEVNSTTRSEDEEYAYQYVKSGLREPVNRLYAEKFSDAQAKRDIEELADNLKEAYKALLSDSKELSEETKEKAIEKLDTLTINALFSEKTEDHTGIEKVASAKTLLDAADALTECKRQSMISKMNKKSDGAWDFDITDVAVSYWPAQNCINIGAGIVGGDFYNKDTSYEEKLGRIGSVIAGEMATVISGKGSLYDEEGKASDWWENKDKEVLSQKREKLSGRMKSFKPFKNDTAYDGDRVIAKMQSEISGIEAALEASKEQKGFDHDKFFRSYATLHREIMTEETMEITGLNATTPLSYILVNEALSENETFTETYDIKEDNKMFVSDMDRYSLW